MARIFLEVRFSTKETTLEEWPRIDFALWEHSKKLRYAVKIISLKTLGTKDPGSATAKMIQLIKGCMGFYTAAFCP